MVDPMVSVQNTSSTELAQAVGRKSSATSGGIRQISWTMNLANSVVIGSVELWW
jgi:hypothetical protein